MVVSFPIATAVSNRRVQERWNQGNPGRINMRTNTPPG
jgi:hypothetical protein